MTANDDRPIREKIRSALLPSGPKSIAEPEKELRFTRAGQAPLFYIIAALTVAAGIGLLILSTQKWGMDAPPLQSWWWLGIPDLLIGFWFFRLGMRCSQHAYLILTPLGIEIFPFFNAQKNLQVIYWTQIAAAEVKDGKLVLHFSEQKNSGVVASLHPIPPQQRELLKRAVEGRMEQRAADGTASGNQQLGQTHHKKTTSKTWFVMGVFNGVFECSLSRPLTQ